ncbi:MAG TPA: inositol monophosphatase family protein [Chthoniobacteraceae bacterium]|nr:inositol monophosphatase family protein [Chthoniobacteraceae bacterium]
MSTDLQPHLNAAVAAAKRAGILLRENFGITPAVNELLDHDIKLELDVHSQDLITSELLSAFPDHALYGEEGIAGNQSSEWQWIVDPIDGTVNYFYGIPHFCISIALRRRDEILLGVIYDPMREDLWSVVRGQTPALNGKPISVSPRTELREAVLSIGFAKSKTTIAAGLPLLEKFIGKARKIRLMGSAALDLAYVACGRLDAYIESSVSLWDIAAGKLLVESAGGKFEMAPRSDNPDKMSVRAWSGRIDIDL